MTLPIVWIVSALALLAGVVTSFKGTTFCLKCRQNRILSAVVESRTYVPIPIKLSSSRNATLLVKSDETEVIQLLKSKPKTKPNLKDIDKWNQDGKAFWLDESAIESINAFETNKNIESKLKIRRQPLPSLTKIYRNAGTESEPIFVKATDASLMTSIVEGKDSLIEISAQGQVFKNVTELLTSERILSRASAIAKRVKEEIPLSSPIWKRWNQKTAKYNTTNLEQVFAEYFQDYSIGDVGGSKARYIRKRGYPGTLAPGENFIDNYPIEDLPNKVLHPWPALQEFQFHVRWPPGHPMLPQPLLWTALNNKFSRQAKTAEEMKAIDKRMGSDDVVVMGGEYMQTSDAIRIATFHQLGLPFDPADQIPHGGMIHHSGHQIPFYNPDHAPTVPLDELDPPVPDELLHITEKRYDPTEKQIKQFLGPQSEKSEEELEEEELRRVTAEKIIEALGENAWGAENAAAAVAFDRAVWERVMTRRKNILAALADPSSNAPYPYPLGLVNLVSMSSKEISQRLMDYDLALARKDVEFENELMATLNGRVRNPRALLKYTVETMEDIQTQILRVESETMTRKKKRRRVRKKKGSAVEADADVIAQLAEAEPTAVFDDMAASPSTSMGMNMSPAFDGDEDVVVYDEEIILEGF